MRKAAKHEKLKKAFHDHLEETKEHKQRLAKICKELGIKPTGAICKASMGLIDEAEDFVKEKTTDQVNDAGIIADAQRIEHYQISGYGTLVRYAKELGYKELASQLQKTLDQEPIIN